MVKRCFAHCLMSKLAVFVLAVFIVSTQVQASALTHYLWVPCFNDDAVYKVNVITHTTEAVIHVGHGPGGIAVGSRFVYVTHRYTPYLYRISKATDLVDSVYLGSYVAFTLTVAVDSLDQVYVIGRKNIGAVSTDAAWIMKLDSNGQLLSYPAPRALVTIDGAGGDGAFSKIGSAVSSGGQLMIPWTRSYNKGTGVIALRTNDFSVVANMVIDPDSRGYRNAGVCYDRYGTGWNPGWRGTAWWLLAYNSSTGAAWTSLPSPPYGNLAVDNANDVWLGLTTPNTLARFDPTSKQFFLQPVGWNPSGGISIDTNGYVWVVYPDNNALLKYDVYGRRTGDTVRVGNKPLGFGDMTGYQPSWERFLPPPEPPMLFASQNPVCVNTEYCLIWTAVERAISYEIRKNSGNWIDMGNVTQLCYNDSIAGTYSYSIRAKSNWGTGIPSSSPLLVRVGSPDTTLSPTTATNPACLGVEYCVDWQPVIGATSYEISENSGGWIDVENVIHRCYTKFATGNYTYSVRARNGCGIGGKSGSLLVIVSPVAPRPSPPTAAPAQVCTSVQYCVIWQSVSGATSYELRENGVWQNVGNVTQKCTFRSLPGIYSYAVRAKIGTCPGDASDSVMVSVAGTPAKPDTVFAAPNPACVNTESVLSWAPVAGATSYDYRYNSNSWVNVGNVTERHFTMTSPGSYNYYVRAVNSCGPGASSNPVTFVVILGPPSPPVISPLNPVCLDSEYCVSWTLITGATSYEIREGNGAWNNVGKSLDTCFHKSAAGIYTYAVRAVNICGAGNSSSSRDVTILGIPGPATAPTALPASPCVNQPYMISWSSIAGATSYDVRENGGQWDTLGSVTQRQYVKSDSGTYSYAVRGRNKCYIGSASELLTITISGGSVAPPTPGQPTPTAGCNKIDLSWSSVSGATSYCVYRDGQQQTCSVTGTSWTDNGPGASQRCYTISAKNGCRESGQSQQSCATAKTYSVTITSNPTGRTVIVDGSPQTAPVAFNCECESSHTISVSSPQSVSTGTQYVFSQWNDAGNQTHQITVTGPATYTATFTTQYQLTTTVNPPGLGSISPSSGSWYNSGQSVQLTAIPVTNYMFHHWSGDVSGTNNPTSVTMNSPKSVTANFDWNSDVTEIVSVELPSSFALMQNYPNPFNPATEIQFSILSHSAVTLEIFDITGRKIATLADQVLSVGTYRAIWDGKDESGNSVSSGVYFYRLRAGDFTETKKMVLMK